MLRILATAYDVNPYKGSESGSGWNFLIQASHSNQVLAFTRKNNRQVIEDYIKEFDINISNITFHYFDLPKWAMFWKKKERFSKLYFYLWQFFLPIYVYSKGFKFDIAHNINFHTDSVPTFLWVLKKPTIWGPINHNEPLKFELVGFKTYIKDRLKWILKLVSWRIDPFNILAQKNSTIIIGAHSSVKTRLKIPRNKFYQLTTIASSPPKRIYTRAQKDTFDIAVVGRQIPIKLVDLSIIIFNNFYLKLSDKNKKKVKLHILGSGEMHIHLSKLAAGLPCSDAIIFSSWIPHKEMDRFYSTKDCLLNCSFEAAGAIVAESLSYGLPVLCFKDYGAGEAIDDSCGIRIPYLTKDESIELFSEGLLDLFESPNLLAKLSQGAINQYNAKLSWSHKGKELKNIYHKTMEISKNV